jgi:flagellar hook-associated protein 3 FlgL
MVYRVSSSSYGFQAIQSISNLNSNLFKYQRQISSGLRIERPSDDPVAIRQVTSLKARLEELRTSSASVRDAETKLNISVSQLTETKNLLTSAKVLAQQGVQALSQAERNALATEAESLLSSLQKLSGVKLAGSFLYSGTKSDVKPFSFDDPAVTGGTLDVQYAGSKNNSTALVGETVNVDTFYAGDHVFGNPEPRGDTILVGGTGAKLGTGTDNLIGRATLSVRHTATTFLGASGIAAGSDSAGGDTIIGDVGANTLTINDTSGDGSAGTISLNGGTPVAYTGSDTNLEIRGPDGNKIYVDTTAISAGFSDTIDLKADGVLSVDGGLSETPIDFSASQTITDSTSGRFVHIDSQSVSETGDDSLEFPDTSNVFQVVYELIADLRNTRGLDNTQLASALDRRIGELDSASNNVLDVMGRQAASLQALSQLDSRVQDLQLETETHASELQATNVAETVLRMQNDQALLEYTYAITAQITSTSLIDFLR